MKAVFYKVQSVLLVLAIVALATGTAFAQGSSGSTTLSGTVADSSGGVIPGADVIAKNKATGAELRAVTDGEGRFTIPAISPGMYVVTVSLMGFKTASYPEVQILTSTPATMKVTLTVGALTETITVKGSGTDVVQTRSASISTTITAEQIRQLPLVTHTALDAVTMMAGVNTAGSNSRGSTINGLPGATINITLDGVNVQDNRGHEGFFMYIRPMLDSIEEISVSTSTPGAEASGQGAANIRMTTRSGANQFSGSAYNTWRNQAGTNDDDTIDRKKSPRWMWGMNTPYWFNKRDIKKTAAGDYFINDVRLQTPGFRVGGPVMKDKLFYFYNHEWFLWPNSINRTRTVLNESARAGLFSYPAVNGSGTQTINVLALATAAGQLGTMDPTIVKLLADIRAATGTTGSLTAFDENRETYSYIPSGTQKRHFPTVRVDANLTQSHRLSFTYRYNMFQGTPDILNGGESRFPGFPNVSGQDSQRYSWTGAVRSTLGKNVVNEFQTGKSDALGKGTYFGRNIVESAFNCSDPGCQSIGGQPYSLGIPFGLTGATTSTAPSASVAPLFNIDDTLTWLRGNHSLSFGGSYTNVTLRAWADTVATGVTLGLSSLDPAFAMWDKTNTAIYPGGINDSYVGNVRDLYALLTGRVTSLAGTAYLANDGTYQFNGERYNAATANQFGFFASDAWRMKPNLTLTAGLRYELQLAMTTDGQYSRPDTWQMVYGLTGAGDGKYGEGNLYQPGVLTGVAPSIVAYENNRPAYNTDFNNLAPSVGIVWQPNVGTGFMSKILSSEPVIRGGYSQSYTRLGVDFFDSNYSGNPGRTRAASRSSTTGTPVWGSDGWPVLLRTPERLVPSVFPATVQYPITPAVNETLDIHYPDWPVPLTHQYSIGLQRSFGRDTAFEARYVGNMNVGGWGTWNMTSNSQWAILENGFYDEFRKAQANLRANIAAGLGNTFQYTGAAGTSPLPIYMAYFKGIPLNDPRNADPAQYASGGNTANFRNSAWYNNLNMYNPALTTHAGFGNQGLQNSGLAANAAAAGLPINFFSPNPSVGQGSAFLETTVGNTTYNAMQFELRRRLSGGVSVNGSYQWMFGRLTSSQNSLREDWYYLNSGGGPLHAVKMNAIAQLPFGRGKRWGSNSSGWVNGLIGGWEVNGVGRFQSGARFNIGGFRLVGMTADDVQKMFKLYKVQDPTRLDANNNPRINIYMFPQDVIEQTIIAQSTTSATSVTGYSGVLPSGRYFAPANGPDCVSYIVMKDNRRCDGTAETRYINGPWYGKVDMSFKKQIALAKSMRIEATMDIFNIFNAINYNAVGISTGSTKTGWEVTSAATDTNASQDPGGRITSFGLRFTW